MAAKHTGTYYNLSTILFVQYVLNAILLVMLWQQSLHSFSWKLQLNVYATFCESDTASDITLADLVQISEFVQISEAHSVICKDQLL